ncbi:MAG: hypothetical protein LBC86_08650, partial [Oscillospiraceae bacterium]|nr:hypothetical protein [Oscillospiraceae bacterium]
MYQPLTVFHRFDEGFVRRYGGTTARNMITRYQREASAILVNVFDLIVDTHSIVGYTSISDTCKKQTGTLTTARLSRLCDCEDNECILNYIVRDDLDKQFPIVNTARTDFCTINKARISWSGHLLLEDIDTIARPMWW